RHPAALHTPPATYPLDRPTALTRHLTLPLSLHTPPLPLPASIRPQIPTTISADAVLLLPAIRNSSPASPATSDDAATDPVADSATDPDDRAGGKGSARLASCAPRPPPTPRPAGCHPADGRVRPHSPGSPASGERKRRPMSPALRTTAPPPTPAGSPAPPSPSPTPMRS